MHPPDGMTAVDLPHGRRVFAAVGSDPDAVPEHVGFSQRRGSRPERRYTTAPECRLGARQSFFVPPVLIAAILSRDIARSTPRKTSVRRATCVTKMDMRSYKPSAPSRRSSVSRRRRRSSPILTARPTDWPPISTREIQSASGASMKLRNSAWSG